MGNSKSAAFDYSEYKKPKISPPEWVFGPVWTVLYTLIAISLFIVFAKLGKQELPFIVALPFILNIISNLLYTPVNFGLKNLGAATIIIYLILATTIWAMVAIWKYSRPVTYMYIPYVLWVSFATILQTTVWRMNSKK